MNKLPNSFFRLIGGLLILFFINGCATYKLSTLNHDPIYDSAGNSVDISVINNEYELARKFKTDDTFRWNFARYAMNQDLRWHYDFYWNNRMHRSTFRTPFDFYWNSHEYWWNWSSNYSFHFGFNHWNTLGFNGWGWNYWNRYDSWRWGYGHPFYNNYGWRNEMNDFAWRNRNRSNTAYILGRRGSNIANYNNRTISDQVTIRNNKPRRVINIDNVDRVIRDFKDRGLDVKIINNSNNDQINRSNPRIYLRPESGSNGGRSWSRENISPKPVKPIITPPSQPRQIRGGQRSSSVQQSISRGSTSGQRGGGTIRQRN